MTLAPVDRDTRKPWETTRTLLVLADLVGPSDWRPKAACRGADPRLFSPNEDGVRGRSYPIRAIEAARHCRACPVLESCRRHADECQEVGVWAASWRNKVNFTVRGSKPAAEDPNYSIIPIPERLPTARKRVRSAAS